MQLRKCSIIFGSLAFRKNSLKNPPSPAISPHIRHARKFFQCACHYWVLNFCMCIPISSFLPVLLPCSCLGNRSGPLGGGLLLWCSFLWGWLWKNGESTVSFHTQSRLVKIITSTKKLGWSSSAGPEQVGTMRGPWWVPAAPLARACCTVTLLPPFPTVIIKQVH